MGGDDGKSMRMVDWVDSFFWSTVSEQYDDLVKRPKRVMTSLDVALSYCYSLYKGARDV